MHDWSQIFLVNENIFNQLEYVINYRKRFFEVKQQTKLLYSFIGYYLFTLGIPNTVDLAKLGLCYEARLPLCLADL